MEEILGYLKSSHCKDRKSPGVAKLQFSTTVGRCGGFEPVPPSFHWGEKCTSLKDFVDNLVSTT